MKTLTFETSIAAPREHVWRQMLGPQTYTQWTAPFAEGSRYEGSWDEGAKMRFIGPSGDGMLSVIEKNEPQRFVSIRHIGMVENGVEDTTSEKVRAWTPAYENYRFADAPGGVCQLTVTVDTAPEWEQYMQEAFPKALATLKAMCER